MVVSLNSGTPKSSHFNRVFHYKPSILGYLYFWKHPYGWLGGGFRFGGEDSHFDSYLSNGLVQPPPSWVFFYTEFVEFFCFFFGQDLNVIRTSKKTTDVNAPEGSIEIQEIQEKIDKQSRFNEIFIFL